MATQLEAPASYPSDPVSNVLKWILLIVAIATFVTLGVAVVNTYRQAPPQPNFYVAASGVRVMTGDQVVAGKAGFQKADLMDYGSLYGMGSYYGEDYTASILVRMATLTQDGIAQTRFGKAFATLTFDQQASVGAVMRTELQSVNLSKQTVIFPAPLASAIGTLQKDLAGTLGTVDRDAGWTPAYSLKGQDAANTADFLIFSALTTVARRPGLNWSWTENWPYEPLVGNVPTTNTFHWTWISFCFTFFAFGAVLFIYEFFLSDPDDAPMDPVLAKFGALTPSQKRVGKYFLLVAAVLLLQIGAGTVMAHSRMLAARLSTVQPYCGSGCACLVISCLRAGRF